MPEKESEFANKKNYLYLILLVFCAVGTISIILHLIHDYQKTSKDISEKKTVISVLPVCSEMLLNSQLNIAELRIIVQSNDDKYILCQAMNNDEFGWNRRSIAEAKVIIESEIRDNDKEVITLTGIYNNNKFEFMSVSANGFTVSAEKKNW